MGSSLGCYIWKKVKPINKLVYWHKKINYLYPFLLSVSEIIWRESQNVWSTAVQLKTQKFGLLIFISGEPTKIFFQKLNINLPGAGVLLRFLVFYLGRKMEIKGKTHPKIYLLENFCLVLQAVFGFEHAKFHRSSFCPTRPFWPASFHADSKG